MQSMIVSQKKIRNYRYDCPRLYITGVHFPSSCWGYAIVMYWEGQGGIFNLLGIIYVISVMVDCTPFPVEPCAGAGGGEGEQEGPVAI